MPFFQRTCLLDLSCVVRVTPGAGYTYNPQLPGYLSDLRATFGSLVVVAFASWVDRLPGATQLEKVIALDNDLKLARTHFRVLDDEDPLHGVWDLRRQLDLDFSRCFIYLGPVPDSRMESFARELGIVHLRTVDSSLC
jgi:hypothetical protein